ncbi:hypothetical protein F4823DRAFT_565080 [Ustulina deusta]|nr:hypothetical protein F4823DRAFT_565080 [Ustulina deusta]
MSLSMDTIINIIFGLVACLIAIAGVIATVRTGRKQRSDPIDALPGTPLSRKQTFQFVRLETVHSSTVMTVLEHSTAIPVQRDSAANSSRVLVEELRDNNNDALC